MTTWNPYAKTMDELLCTNSCVGKEAGVPLFVTYHPRLNGLNKKSWDEMKRCITRKYKSSNLKIYVNSDKKALLYEKKSQKKKLLRKQKINLILRVK